MRFRAGDFERLCQGRRGLHFARHFWLLCRSARAAADWRRRRRRRRRRTRHWWQWRLAPAAAAAAAAASAGTWRAPIALSVSICHRNDDGLADPWGTRPDPNESTGRASGFPAVHSVHGARSRGCAVRSSSAAADAVVSEVYRQWWRRGRVPAVRNRCCLLFVSASFVSKFLAAWKPFELECQENGLFEPFTYQNDHSTKTGSGQT